MTDSQVPRVKICGHTRSQDIYTSAHAGADAIGIITDVPVDTPREVSIDQATQLIECVPPMVTSVCVTMPESVEQAQNIADQTDPDILQIHTSLSPSDIAKLSDNVDSSIMVAVDAEDVGMIKSVAPVSDLVLVDSTSDSGGGGTGRTHDWSQTREIIQDILTPVILAGGLTPENVADAIQTAQPYGVDVASGVESRGGIKDKQNVTDFISAAYQRRVPV